MIHFFEFLNLTLFCETMKVLLVLFAVAIASAHASFNISGFYDTPTCVPGSAQLLIMDYIPSCGSDNPVCTPTSIPGMYFGTGCSSQTNNSEVAVDAFGKYGSYSGVGASGGLRVSPEGYKTCDVYNMTTSFWMTANRTCITEPFGNSSFKFNVGIGYFDVAVYSEKDCLGDLVYLDQSSSSCKLEWNFFRYNRNRIIRVAQDEGMHVSKLTARKGKNFDWTKKDVSNFPAWLIILVVTLPFLFIFCSICCNTIGRAFLLGRFLSSKKQAPQIVLVPIAPTPAK
jgi:hypothetical protein